MQNQQGQPGQQPQPGMQQQPGQPGQSGQGQVMTSQPQQPMQMGGQPQMGGNMAPQQPPQMMQQQRYRNIQLQQQQQQQTQNFGNFQQPAPPYPGAMRPGGAPQGGQYGGPNMMHQGGMGGPQTSVSMAAQQMLAQVRSPPGPPNVRSPGPRGPMGMGMQPSPRGMQPSPRHPQPQLDDTMLSHNVGHPVGQPGQGGQGGPGDSDNGQTGMTPQDQLSKYVETL